MIKVGLIGCTSKKKNYFCKSEEMYSPSKYFQLRMEYCKKMNFDYIYIECKIWFVKIGRIYIPIQPQPKKHFIKISKKLGNKSI